MDLATQAGDSYRACYALRHAAMMSIDRDQPNNAAISVSPTAVHQSPNHSETMCSGCPIATANTWYTVHRFRRRGSHREPER